MRFIGTPKIGTDPFSQLTGREQAVRFHHVALAMNPFRFNGIEPGTLLGQQERQDMYACTGLLNLHVVLTDPGANSLTNMPRSMIPDQEPVGLPKPLETLTAPLQELDSDSTHRATSDEAQPHLRAVRLLGRPFLP